MSQSDVKNKFAKILASLPQDKKVELYNKLKTLPEVEREKAIYDIVARYDNSNNNTNANKQVNHIAVSHNPYPEKPITSTNQKKNNFNKVKPAVKKTGNSNKAQKKSTQFITLMVIDAILVIAVIILILSKLNLMGNKEKELAVESTTMVETTEVVETTIPLPTETPTPSPTPTTIPDGNEGIDLTGLVIVIDPGHQEVTSEEYENCASWLGTEKPRCTSGAIGVTTGVTEYDLTLKYSQMVGTYLEQKGATVIYTRVDNAVDVSNQERAQIATVNNANIFLRIHADATNDGVTSGIRVYVPDTGDYTTSSVTNGNRLGQLLANAEGLEFKAVTKTNQYTGLNYANTVPSYQVSLGFLSNSDDEAVLVSEDNMVNVAYAIAQFCSEVK